MDRLNRRGGADWILEDIYTGRPFATGLDYIEIIGGVAWPRDRAGHCVPSWESADDIITIEVVIDVSDCDIESSGNKQIVTFGGGKEGLGNGQWLQTLYLTEHYLCCRGGMYPKVPLQKGINYVSLDPGHLEVLINGEQITTEKAIYGNYSYTAPVLSAYSGTVPSGIKIKTMRIYGRSLIDKERFYNYSIDKERFGL